MKFLLIDGNSIMNRSFYAIRLLSNKKGVFTNAITGFFNSLLKYKTALNPDFLAVAFDMRAKTFRHEMYDGYKAKRKGMPDELAMQLPFIKEILDYTGIKRVEAEGWEADDIIGTLSKSSYEQNCDCYISTGDRDSFQLVNERVSVCLASTKEEITYTPEKIKEIYGLEPLQLIEVKALMGDASDEIPGVAGIGEKTALTLIQKFNSVDYIYENLNNFGKNDMSPSVKLKLEKDKETCYLSRKLGTIALNAPVDLNLDNYKIGEVDYQKLSELLTELEMASLMKKLGVEPNLKQEETDLTVLKPIPEDLDFNPELATYILDLSPDFYSPEQLYNMILSENLEKLLFEVEQPLSAVLSDMEKAGVKIDVNGIARFGTELQAGIAQAEKLIYASANEEFNIASPKQLGEILFEKLNLPCGKKTKTGYSTDADALEALNDKHEIIPLIREYRALTKLNSTYVQGLLKAVKDDGRIHTTYRQTETKTGRLSSVEPNIQNIPVRTERGRIMRRFFIAEEGNELIDADYSQIELRVLAAVSNDEIMLSAFKNGDDIHAITASQVFGVAEKAVTREMRSAAKAVNFGIVYGMGAFSLSKEIGVSVAQADFYIKNYLEKYKGVREYLEKTVSEAKRNGYVKTLLGRIRRVPELAATNKNTVAFGERIAKNTPIQGTAADIIKIAMLRVRARLNAEIPASKLILQVHDELIAEAPKEFSEQTALILKEEMVSAGETLGISAEVDVKIGKSWFETH